MKNLNFCVCLRSNKCVECISVLIKHLQSAQVTLGSHWFLSIQLINRWQVVAQPRNAALHQRKQEGGRLIASIHGWKQCRILNTKNRLCKIYKEGNALHMFVRAEGQCVLVSKTECKHKFRVVFFYKKTPQVTFLTHCAKQGRITSPICFQFFSQCFESLNWLVSCAMSRDLCDMYCMTWAPVNTWTSQDQMTSHWPLAGQTFIHIVSSSKKL